MSAGVKIAHHPDILKKKSYQIGGCAQFEKYLVASTTGLADTQEIGNVQAQCSVDFVKDGGVDFVRVNPKPLKVHRSLPFQPNGLTYITLDNTARLVLSGPLTGCHIYVAQTAGGAITIMHVNWNKMATTTPEGKAANSAKKLQLATSLAAALPGNAAITNSLVYNPTPNHIDYYDHLAFLVARRLSATGPWDFYVSGVGANGSILKKF